MKDTEMYNSIKSGSEEAIRKLIEKYSKLLWSVAGGILKDCGCAHDTEEVVADVFIQLWRYPEKFDESRGSLKSYLCLLCRSKAIDRLRSIQRRQCENLDELLICDFIDVESKAIANEEISQLLKAMDDLTEEEKEFLELRTLCGKKPKEISELTGKDLRHIENVLYRTKSKLRKSLNE